MKCSISSVLSVYMSLFYYKILDYHSSFQPWLSHSFTTTLRTLSCLTLAYFPHTNKSDQSCKKLGFYKLRDRKRVIGCETVSTGLPASDSLSQHLTSCLRLFSLTALLVGYDCSDSRLYQAKDGLLLILELINKNPVNTIITM